MATIEKKNAIQRQPGRLYFIDAKGNVCSAPMKNRPQGTVWDRVWRAYIQAKKSGDAARIKSARARVRRWHVDNGMTVPSWARA